MPSRPVSKVLPDAKARVYMNPPYLGLDPLPASVPRITNYFLGGKDYFTSDRVAAEKLLEQVPSFRRSMQDQRRFVLRAASSLAAMGYDRFIDLGCGMPIKPGLHDVVRHIQPSGRFVAVDIDPSVVAYARVLAGTDDRIEVLTSDVRDMQILLKHARIQDMLSTEHHTVIVAGGLLQFFSNSAAAEIIACLRENLPPAGRLIVSHLCGAHTSPTQLQAIAETYEAAGTEIWVRHLAEIRNLFDGWTWVEPGLVPVTMWQAPNDVPSRFLFTAQFVGGIAMPDEDW